MEILPNHGFGLNQSDLLNLSNLVDIVINSAAKVSHYGNYQDFYNTNVKSVNNIIEFCQNFSKKFYQISTLSISGNSFDSNSIKQNFTGTINFSENNLYVNQSLENVYVRSKFEAECKTLEAISKGLDAYILRLGNLMPRINDGKFQENIQENAYINRLISFLRLRAIPDYMKDIYLEFTPIDSASDSIIKLIQNPTNNNRIFHLFDHNHVYIDTILKILKKFNIKLNMISDDNFKELIKETLNNKKTKDILNLLINDFDDDLNLLYKTGIVVDSDFSVNYLNKLKFKWPEINRNYLMNFIKLIRRLI